MATLRNHTDADIFLGALHVMVPANSSVEIDEDDAEAVNTGSENLLSIERAQASRATARRGSKTAEVSGKPDMETR